MKIHPMKTVLTVLSLTFVTMAVSPIYAIDVTMEATQVIGMRDKGLYKSTKSATNVYLRSIDDIKKDFLSSKGIFDGTTDFSIPIEHQRKAVVVYMDEYRGSVAEQAEQDAAANP
jgi:hypothetical protein